MKEYLLNVRSSMLHSRGCPYTRTYKETKWRKFHTVEEAKLSCERIDYCSRCLKIKED